MTTLLSLNTLAPKPVQFAGRKQPVRFGDDLPKQDGKPVVIKPNATATTKPITASRKRLGIAAGVITFALAACGIGVAATGGNGGGQGNGPLPSSTVPAPSSTTPSSSPSSTTPSTPDTEAPQPECKSPFAVGPFAPTDFSFLTNTTPRGNVIFPQAPTASTIPNHRFSDTELRTMMGDFADKMSSRTNADNVYQDMLSVYDDPGVKARIPNDQWRAALALGLALFDDDTVRAEQMAFVINGNLSNMTINEPVEEGSYASVFVNKRNEPGIITIRLAPSLEKEHPILLALVIMGHEILHWDVEDKGIPVEEVIASGFDKLAYIKVLGQYPELLEKPSDLTRYQLTFALQRLNSSNGSEPILSGDVDNLLPGSDIDERLGLRGFRDGWSVKESSATSTPGNPILSALLKAVVNDPSLAGNNPVFDQATINALDSGIQDSFLSDADAQAFVDALKLIPANPTDTCPA